MSLPRAVRRTLLLGGGGAGVFAGTVAAWRYRRVLERERNLLSVVAPLAVFSDTADGSSNNISNNNGNKKQRVIVIGGGVVGVSAAHRLAHKGHAVVVLEPQPHAGEECSACAAGGMQVSNPVVDRASWIAVTKCIVPTRISRLLFGGGGGGDSSSAAAKKEEVPFRFFQISWAKTLSDPFFLRWVLTFTKTSLFPGPDQADKQSEMLKFTKYAVDDMVGMMENKRDKSLAEKSGYNRRGSISVSYDAEPVAAVVVQETPASADAQSSNTKASTNPSQSKMNVEPSRRLVGRDEVLREEPSLRFQLKQPTSAKYEYEAKSASSGRFAKELARRCVSDPKLDISFLYDTRVLAISTTDGDNNSNSSKPRISKLHTNQGVITVPRDVKVVVAAGAWMPHVLALMDLYAPVYPLKGYAMSVSAAEALRQGQGGNSRSSPSLSPRDLPSRIVCDKYMFTTRLGDDEIRITSIGEFSGWDTDPTPPVDEEFRHEAGRQFPQLRALIDKARTGCGLRPFVSDGILLLGAVDTHDNLFVSCGPGSNGWKLATGSAEVINRLVEGQSTDEISRDLGFDAGVFSPAGRVLHAPLFAKLCRARWNV